jgi:O-succinylbenzoate synthase
MMRKLFCYTLNMKDGKERKGLILQLGNGFGEIAPLPGFSSESLEEAQREAEGWLQTGKSPTLPSVRFGIACAHKPLQSIHIPLSSLGYKLHFPTVKLKLGHLSVDEAISYVKEHYRKCHLRLDCNRAWSLDQALEFASHFKPTDFAYLEEPVQTFQELVTFSRLTGFPIALDESIHENWNEIPSLKAIVVKPTIVGFIPHVPPSLDLVLSSAYESGLGLLHIAHLAQTPLPVGLDTYHLFQEDLLLKPIDCSTGYFSWTHSNPILNFSKLCAL